MTPAMIDNVTQMNVLVVSCATASISISTSYVPLSAYRYYAQNRASTRDSYCGMAVVTDRRRQETQQELVPSHHSRADPYHAYYAVVRASCSRHGLARECRPCRQLPLRLNFLRGLTSLAGRHYVNVIAVRVAGRVTLTHKLVSALLEVTLCGHLLPSSVSHVAAGANVTSASAVVLEFHLRPL